MGVFPPVWYTSAHFCTYAYNVISRKITRKFLDRDHPSQNSLVDLSRNSVIGVTSTILPHLTMGSAAALSHDMVISHSHEADVTLQIDGIVSGKIIVAWFNLISSL